MTNTSKEKVIAIARNIMRRYDKVFRELAKGPEDTPAYLNISLDDASLANMVFTYHAKNKLGEFGEIEDWDVVWRAFTNAIIEDIDREEIFQKLKNYWAALNPAELMYSSETVN